MKFSEIVQHAGQLLQTRGRVTYRALKREFDLDEEALADLKDELLFSDPQVKEEGERGLVWIGTTPAPSPESRVLSFPQSLTSKPQPPAAYTPAHLADRIRAVSITDGERKTITALFADLKGSTALIEGLDPEEARTILDPALQLMMNAVHQYDGVVAQALGDGIFALFGAPLAHEDHPQRAVYEEPLNIYEVLGIGQLRTRFPVLWGLWAFHRDRGEIRMAQTLAEECLQLAEQTHEAGMLCEAHYAVGSTVLLRGELVRARAVLEQSLAHYQPQHHALTPLYAGLNPKVLSLDYTALTLWVLGYPEQALTRVYEALHLAQELSHPHSLAVALTWTAMLHSERGDGHLIEEHADALVALSSEHGFSFFLGVGTVFRGVALLSTQEQWAEGIARIQQGLEVWEGETWMTLYLAWLAREYGGAGQVEEGWRRWPRRCGWWRRLTSGGTRWRCGGSKERLR